MSEEQTTSDAALYVYDGIGNPVALLESWNSVSQGNTYDPYGVTTIASWSTPDVVAHNPYGFKGGIQDTATGLVKFGQRWYNAVTGSWTQQDTMDAPLDPANANRYAYAGDDPINNIDPSGMDLTEAQCKVQRHYADKVLLASAILTGVGFVTSETGIGAAAAGAGIGGVIGAAALEVHLDNEGCD